MIADTADSQNNGLAQDIGRFQGDGFIIYVVNYCPFNGLTQNNGPLLGYHGVRYFECRLYHWRKNVESPLAHEICVTIWQFYH